MKKAFLLIALFFVAILLSGCIEQLPAPIKQVVLDSQKQLTDTNLSDIFQIVEKNNLTDNETETKEIVLNPEWECDFNIQPTDNEFFLRLRHQVNLACEKAILIQEELGFPLKSVYSINFENDSGFSALYNDKGEIIFTYQGISAPGLQYTIIHEMTHSALEDIPLPKWFAEGLSERMADIAFNRDTTLVRDVNGIENLDPFYVDNIIENNINYRYANYLVKNFVEKYGQDTLKEVLKTVYEQQIYGNAESRNESLVAAVRKVTGDDSITLEDLVYPSE